ncbi:MAG: hypothetical protein PWP76_468 [Candidatus Diapherotrites archaeon]|nr:hypothetical protein [Candidatus Diapherotrites archaeon]MDN5366639.1 hypothetical protein [Candidatus Diapherotrites archaeon]
MERNLQSESFANRSKQILAARLGMDPGRVRYVRDPDSRAVGKMDYDPWTAILTVHGPEALSRAIVTRRYVEHERHHIYRFVPDEAVDEVLASHRELKEYFDVLRRYARGEDADPKMVANALLNVPDYFRISRYGEHLVYHILPVAHLHEESPDAGRVRKEIDTMKRMPVLTISKTLPRVLSVALAIPAWKYLLRKR